MKKKIYDFLKNDQYFHSQYLKHHKTLWGFKSFLKGIIDGFISDYDIYLDEPYLDICYLRVNNKIIDLDLLYFIFNESLREGYWNDWDLWKRGFTKPCKHCIKYWKCISVDWMLNQDVILQFKNWRFNALW